MKVESFDNKTGLDSQIYKNSLTEDFSKQFDNAAVNPKDGVKKFDFSTCSSDGILLRNYCFKAIKHRLPSQYIYCLLG